MKGNYSDLVICTDKRGSHPHMLKAPAWSGLKEGDDVITETGDVMVVERSYTFEMSDERLGFFMLCAGAEFPLKKIVQKIEYKRFEFADEDSEHEERGIDQQT